MTREVLLLLLGFVSLLHGAAYTSNCSGSPCNWSVSTNWIPQGVPGDGDTVSIANGHTVVVNGSATAGTSGAPVYSQVTAVSVHSAGSGGSGACTVAFSGGTMVNSSPAKATCTLSGGAVTSVALTDRGWYAGASTQPTCSFSATGLTGAACSVDAWVQGGGTAAINLNASGQLTIATSATLTVRGSIQYTGGSSNTANSITMQPGSGLVFDSSQAAGTPIYDFGQTAESGYRHIYAVCNQSQRCRISATGNIGVISTHGFLRGGGITAKYVDFSNIGDSLTPNQIGWYYSNVTYDVEHSTFTNCGRWQYMNYAGADSTLIHSNNFHANTNDTTPLYVNGSGALTTGTRQINGNVFDKLVGSPASPLLIPGVTLTDNYFGGGYSLSLTSSNVPTSLARNLVRVPYGQNPQHSAATDFVDNYVLLDGSIDNPHVLTALETTPITARGNVFGHTDDISSDSGELLAPRANPASPTVYSFLDNIVLPNRVGNQYAEAAAITTTFSNFRAVIDHNVWFGGRNALPGGFGILQINEGGNSLSFNASSLRSNILWSQTSPVNWWVKVNTATKTNPQIDVIDPAMADYNLGWNFFDVQPGCSLGCANMGNGYGGAWSTTPGVHDINANPRFADYQRTLELFDSKYLGHFYPDWSGAASYSVGDEVSHAVAGYTWGLAVNYRYTNGAGCSGANPEPGNTAGNATWRNCWEFSSLYRLREGIRLQQTYTDGAIGASGDTIIMALIKWTRRGYTPQNLLLFGSGHDNCDIGAVGMERPRVFAPVTL